MGRSLLRGVAYGVAVSLVLYLALFVLVYAAFSDGLPPTPSPAAPFTVDPATGIVTFKQAPVFPGSVALPITKLTGPILVVGGALRLVPPVEDLFISPLGSNLPTVINVPMFDPGAFGQIFAFGLNAGSTATARAMMIIDARTAGHQPTLSLVSPDETQLLGLSWNGSNTNAELSSSVNLKILATQIVVPLPASAGSGGLFVCVDTNGVLYKKSTCP